MPSLAKTKERMVYPEQSIHARPFFGRWWEDGGVWFWSVCLLVEDSENIHIAGAHPWTNGRSPSSASEEEAVESLYEWLQETGAELISAAGRLAAYV